MEYKKRSFAEWWRNDPRQPVQEVRSEPLPGVQPPSYGEIAQPVTVHSALSISAVYSATNILTTWISQMDLAVMRNGEAIPTPSIIAQPDTDSTLFQFIKKTVASLALTGDAFWFVSTRQSDGTPVQAQVLNPYLVAIELSKAGKKQFRYNDNLYTEKNIKHIMTTEVPGRLRGLGPIEANNAGLQANLALRKYADNWFNSSGVPKGGYLKSDQELEPEQLTEVRNRWLGQMNDGLPPALGNGFDYQTVSMSPSDAMYLEQQTFAVTEIARWFGIPPYLLLASVDGNSMTYSNLQTDTRLFVTNTLMAYMMPIQEAFSGLLPRGQVVKFKTEALLNGDTQERYEAYATALEAGFLTVNEVRQREGLPPITEGASVDDTNE